MSGNKGRILDFAGKAIHVFLDDMNNFRQADFVVKLTDGVQMLQ